MTELIMFFLIGGAGGFLSGFLGIGGGVILLPMLIYLAHLPLQNAILISLVFIVVAPLAGAVTHARLGNIDYNTGLWLGTSSVFGAVIGALFSSMSTDIFLKFLFLGVILIASLMLLIPRPEEYNLKYCKTSKQKAIAVLIGLGKGVLTGMLGIGGGFIVLPLMICVLHMNTLTAIGTSSLITLFSGIAGLVSKLTTIEQISVSAWLVIISAIPTAQLGSYVASRTKPKILRVSLFILLMIVFVTTLQDIIKTQL